MPWPEKDYIVCEQHRFLYMPIAKVACSSLKAWVIGLAEGTQVARCVDPTAHTLAHYALHAHPRAQQRKWLADPSLFRFAFVRNPWDRLVSAFLNKFVRWKSPAERFVRELESRRRWQRAASWLTGGLLGRGTELTASSDWTNQFTFRQFVAELSQRRPANFDLHWRPQHLFLGRERLDFLGRFENLAGDFRALCRRLKIESELPEKNKTERGRATDACLADCPLAELRTLGGFPDYTRFFTPDLADQVARIYAEDIRRFGYRFGKEGGQRLQAA